jgi:cytidylate kinase
MEKTIITITGDLGSGKSTVSKKLADTLGARRYSVGEAHREIAKVRGLSTLELNRLAEKDPSIDKEIDSVFKGLQMTQENLVVDARMAWFFLSDSIKIKLIASPVVAARRIHADTGRVSEIAGSVVDTYGAVKERRESEQERFLRYYGANSDDDNNFNFVIDTTAATPEQVTKLIESLIISNASRKDNNLWLCSKNLFPTEHVRSLAHDEATQIRASIVANGVDPRFPVKIVEKDRDYLIFDGHKQTSGAIFAGISHVPVVLLKTKEDTGYGEHPEEFFDANLNLSRIYDWEDAHKFQFNHYPTPRPAELQKCNCA